MIAEAKITNDQALSKLQAKALLALGNLHTDTRFPGKDPKAVVSFFERAADSKLCVAALYSLGLCYNNGYGVKQDTGIANSYFTDAEKRGDARAQAYCLLKNIQEEPKGKTISDDTAEGFHQSSL